jgi:hypothetical protein
MSNSETRYLGETIGKGDGSCQPVRPRPHSQKGRVLARLERDWLAWMPPYAIYNPDDRLGSVN